jgi:hypothetical protein
LQAALALWLHAVHRVASCGDVLLPSQRPVGLVNTLLSSLDAATRTPRSFQGRARHAELLLSFAYSPVAHYNILVSKYHEGRHRTSGDVGFRTLLLRT